MGDDGGETMDQYNVKTVTERLRADRKLSTLFSVMQGYGETAAARWADRDGEHGMTFAELAVRADDCAARLHSLAPEGGWVGISVDT